MDYGTGRWLAQSAVAPYVVMAHVETISGVIVVEDLPSSLRRRFGHLRFANAGFTSAAQKFANAIALLARAPGVEELIGTLVRAAHFLRAEPGYDLSHSNPDLPFSIFVSIPAADESDQIVRLAESILHETMHLQLTLIENALPLVDAIASTEFSPWQGKERPLGGVLHGLYVFSVILETFEYLNECDSLLTEYVSRRRQEIREEVGLLPVEPTGLTKWGSMLWVRSRRAVLA
jgi:HEXXH motif-containing protein